MRNDKLCIQVVRRIVPMTLWIVLAAVVARSAKIGPDSSGNIANDSTPYSFLDISSTGTAVLAGADDDTALVNIGFPFLFYGRSYDSVCISSNGLLSFKGCNPDFANQDLSATGTLGDYPSIAPLWSDLTFAAKGAGAVYYQTLGQAGNRQFVVQWQNAFPLNGAKGITFQAILHETGGKILFQYLDLNVGAGSPMSFGGGATVGIRDEKGQTNGRNLQWSYKVPVLRNEEAISFGPPGTPSDTVPPTLQTPSIVVVDATSPAGAVVSYSVSATDNIDPSPVVVCSPPSGSTFPIGDTTVSCNATDASENSSSASFNVHVKGASDQVADLIAFVDGYQLGKLGKSLRDKLLTVQRFLAAGKPQQAEENLSSFIAQVDSQRGKGLTKAQADALKLAAQRILTVIKN